jgi:hypothetical protein
MFEEGTAYVLRSKAENLPEFIPPPPVTSIKKAPIPTSSKWKTLCITGGRRNKISKGDIVGLFFKKGNILSEQIGLIEVQQQYSFVAVHGDIAEQLIQKLNRQRLKKTKIRINIV